RPIDAEGGRHLDPEGEPGLHQHAVSRRLHDGAVKRDVPCKLCSGVPRLRRREHLLDLGLEGGDVTVQAPGRLLRGKLLERRADREDLEQILVGDTADTGATERLRLDEIEELEVAESLPNGRLARAQLLCDPRLDQTVARLQLAAQDALE